MSLDDPGGVVESCSPILFRKVTGDAHIHASYRSPYAVSDGCSRFNQMAGGSCYVAPKVSAQSLSSSRPLGRTASHPSRRRSCKPTHQIARVFVLLTTKYSLFLLRPKLMDRCLSFFGICFAYLAHSWILHCQHPQAAFIGLILRSSLQYSRSLNREMPPRMRRRSTYGFLTLIW